MKRKRVTNQAWWRAAAMLLILAAPAAACASEAADEYLQKYLDLKEKYGLATTERDGVVEARGAVQGKIASSEAIIWMVKDESGDQPVTYQFRSETPLPGFELGTRVWALGVGRATPGTVMELVAMVREAEMAGRERRDQPAAEREGPRQPPTRVIVFHPE
ncbi:MAG: hypothetical protein QHJ73_07065, partial [Armatimonadota bacterium]|nr:hypothetical protein [Armatimonadota bacterium]